MVLAIAFSLALILLIIPGALAENPTPEATAVPEEPPLGECYGGVLSHAPLHCYALEQAEAAGNIHIEGVYLTQPGELARERRTPPENLYIYVTEDQATVQGAVYEYLYEKMKEYAENWPGHVGYGRASSELCSRGISPAACVVGSVEVAGTQSNYYRHPLFTEFGGYAVTQVRGGGKAERRKHCGLGILDHSLALGGGRRF